MADRHRRVCLQQHGRDRLAHDVAAANDDRLFPCNRNAAALQDLNHTGGRAGRQALLPGMQAADVDGVKSINILQG